jgi:hypothetical protein
VGTVLLGHRVAQSHHCKIAGFCTRNRAPHEACRTPEYRKYKTPFPKTRSRPTL